MMFSLRQINHRHLRFPAWLGIAAILMLFIAPVVSKSLVGEGAHHKMMPGMVMSDHDASMAHCQQQTCKSTVHDIANSIITGGMIDAACDYCVLLVHLPMLDLQTMPMLWSLDFSGRAPPLSLIKRFIPSLFFTDAQPRAPPVF